jgi:hypothetical protein
MLSELLPVLLFLEKVSSCPMKIFNTGSMAILLEFRDLK